MGPRRHGSSPVRWALDATEPGLAGLRLQRVAAAVIGIPVVPASIHGVGRPLRPTSSSTINGGSAGPAPDLQRSSLPYPLAAAA
ncbi:unnamed protein product [Urochloa humidicola]